MSDFIFLNVYSGCSPSDKGNSAQHFFWNVYLNEQENIYLIQKLDENNKPTAEKYKISPTFFGINFRKINDVQLETKTKKDIIFVRSKDKTDDLLKANSSVYSPAKKEIADKKKTGEFLIQLSANKPQPIQKKSEEAPKSNLSAKKTTNEFQLGVSAAPKKPANVKDFGLSSFLNTFTQSNKKEKTTLTLSTQNINTPQTAASNPVPPAQAAQSLDTFPFPVIAQNLPEEIKSADIEFDDVTDSAKDEITGTDEALLEPKWDKQEEFKRSEKALKLDMSMRAEFQVSLTHWNSAKKNLAKRHFYDILTRPGNYVPAHKHMFTDFAIKLRKINLQDLALQFATKSTTLSPDDSHVFFNVARLYYELGRYEEAEGFIDRAIELEKNLIPALRLAYIIKECIRRKAQNR